MLHCDRYLIGYPAEVTWTEELPVDGVRGNGNTNTLASDRFLWAHLWTPRSKEKLALMKCVKYTLWHSLTQMLV